MRASMIAKTVLLLLILTVVCKARETGLGCGRRLTGCRECFNQHALRVKRMPLNSLGSSDRINILMCAFLDPEVACLNRSKVKEVARCCLTGLEECQSSDDLGTLPLLDRMQKAIDLLCDEYLNIDTQCFLDHFRPLRSCVTTITNRLFVLGAALPDHSMEEKMCMKADINYDCHKLVLGPGCDSKTTKAYLTMVRYYFLDRACTSPDRDPGRTNRPTFMMFESNGGATTSSTPIATIIITAATTTLLLSQRLALFI